MQDNKGAFRRHRCHLECKEREGERTMESYLALQACGKKKSSTQEHVKGIRRGAFDLGK